MLIISTGLLCFFAASVYITQNNNLNIAKDTVMETARNYADLYTSDTELSAFVKTSGDTRITIIAPDGTVLADSRPLDITSLENHLDRPEVQAAANGSPTAFVRHSDSLGVDMIYYAVTIPTGYATFDGFVYLRAAIPVAKIDAYLFQSLPLLIVLLLAVALLCFAFSRGMIGRVTKPFESVERKLRLLSNGEYVPEPIDGSYEEIDAIIRGIDEVAQVLQSSFADLRDEKTKLDYVMSNIGDGLFVLDDDKKITLINSAALGIFNANLEIVGKNVNYLSNEKTLVDTVRDCVNHNEDALFEFLTNGRIYLTAVKQLHDTKLTMVVLSDVTENRENAMRREEFFANASHELKTPLTAIKGFNELTALNNKDEGINKYIDSITRETDRMLSLIGDMLKLSELENTQNTTPVTVSLKKTAEEVRETLSAAISEKSITLDIIGDGTVEAEPSHVYELIKNLAENAVRYNNPNGRVSVTIENTGIFVYDDGIGISPVEQTRIFERFYRVEKSRGKRGGGTGLGLSIVKHICALYGWELSLKSKLGVGTEITVTFGKK
ncbi:MAG: ATP-binding protein [Dehalococcoidia bacterium]|nr:ATP-binding protein [Dehalococcoidia bacterium]